MTRGNLSNAIWVYLPCRFVKYQNVIPAHNSIFRPDRASPRVLVLAGLSLLPALPYIRTYTSKLVSTQANSLMPMSLDLVVYRTL